MLPKSRVVGRWSFADSRLQTLIFPYKHQETVQGQRKEPFVHEQNKLTVKMDVNACQRPLDHGHHHMFTALGEGKAARRVTSLPLAKQNPSKFITADFRLEQRSLVGSDRKMTHDGVRKRKRKKTLH